MDMVEIEVWVLVDDSGDYAVGKEAEAATEAYESDIGAVSDALATRRVKVTLQIPKPRVLELTGTVPAEPEGGQLLTA